jgi:hypothetical protein
MGEEGKAMRRVEPAGKRRRDSLMQAVVKGRLLRRVGVEEIKEVTLEGSGVKTESCSARTRESTSGWVESRKMT